MFRFGDVLKHTDEYVYAHKELTYIGDRRLMFIADTKSGFRAVFLRTGRNEPFPQKRVSFWGSDKAPESLFVLADD